MDKGEFVQSQNAPSDLASEAWERADGDPDQASTLLSPIELTIKGKLGDDNSNLYGLIMVKWDLRDDDMIGLRSVVVNVPLDDVSLSDTNDSIYRKMKRLEKSGNILSGYTDLIQDPLRELLNDPASNLPRSLLEGGLDGFQKRVTERLRESMDLRDLDVELDTSVRLQIEKMKTSEEMEEEEDEEKVVITDCDIEVAPVKGVALTKLQPGDNIYVDLGTIPDDWMKLRPVLEERRDESGMIPVELISKKNTDDGRMKLEVKFGDKVYGTVHCSPDVTPLVPHSTREKYDTTESFSMDEMMSPGIMVTAGVILVVILISFLLLI